MELLIVSRNTTRKILSKVSAAVVGLTLLSLLLPAFSYAMTAFFFYDTFSGKLRGAVYTTDPDSVHVQTNVNGVLTTLTGISYQATGNSYADDNQPYYSVLFQGDSATKPDSIILSESSFAQPFTMNGMDHDERVDYEEISHNERITSFRMAGSQYFSSYAANTILQPSAPILTFTPTQSLSNSLKVFFPKNSSSSTILNVALLTPQSFNLRDNTLQTNVVIANLYPVYEIDFTILENVVDTSALILEANTNFIAGHSYTLQMSASSHGTEIRLPHTAGSYNASAELGDGDSYSTQPTPIPTMVPATGYSSFTGTIRTNAGLPIPGAEVQVFAEDYYSTVRPYIQKVTADANGQFTIPALPVGIIYLKLIKDGFIPVLYSAAINLNQNNASTFNMNASIIQGYIKDVNGIAIGGAEVSVNIAGTTSYSSISQSEGYFTIKDVPDGDYSLTVTKAAYQNLTTGLNNIYHGYATFINEIDMFPVSPPAVSVPATTGTVKGILKDASTQLRIAGATVRLYSGENSQVLTGTALTDANGIYTFTDIPVGQVRISFEKNGFFPSHAQIFGYVDVNEVSSFGTFELNHSYLTGVVKDANNVGISHAKVALAGTDYKEITDYYGNFTFTNVPNGNYRISVTKLGYDNLTTTKYYNIHEAHISNTDSAIIMVANAELALQPTTFFGMNNKNSIFFDTIQITSPAGNPVDNNTTNNNPNPGSFPPNSGVEASAPTTSSTPAPTKAPDIVTSDPNSGSRITISATPEKSETGQSVLNVLLDTDTFSDALAQLKGKVKVNQVITVDTGNTNSDIANISLYAEALTKAADNPDVVLSIQSDGITYELPLKLLDLEALSKSLGVDAGKGIIHISIEKISGLAADKIIAGVKSAGVEPIGSPIDFTITIEANGVKKELNDFGSTYVSRTITIIQDIDSRQASAVLYDSVTGQFSFVPATFTSVNGKTTITIKRNGNSQYLIVRSDKSFVDTKNMYAEADIHLLASKLIVNGVTPTEFKPYDAITRAQFTALLIRALGLTVETKPAEFSDVKQSDWYVNVISTGVKAGLIQGFADGAFHPDDPITREQMASLIAKAIAIGGKAVDMDGNAAQILSKFSDSSKISGWAASDTALVTQAGIMQGNAGSFAPKGIADRAQAVVTLKRLLVFLQFIN